MKEIILGGGCFWGVQEFFSRIEGIKETSVGYANGITKDPSYEEVCTGKTEYVEVVYIKYEESLISLEEILDRFWSIIDPTQVNGQGLDMGSQYRTGIYYIDELDRERIENSREKTSYKYKDRIATEVEPLKSYYRAEDYHQDYLKKNPTAYCHIKLD